MGLSIIEIDNLLSNPPPSALKVRFKVETQFKLFPNIRSLIKTRVESSITIYDGNIAAKIVMTTTNVSKEEIWVIQNFMNYYAFALVADSR